MHRWWSRIELIHNNHFGKLSNNCRRCYLWVISDASFQLKPLTSINILSSSGMQRVGWVSFICTATFSGKTFQFTGSPDLFSNRAIISWREAEHKVYCCFNLRVFPSSDSSPGYNTKQIWDFMPKEDTVKCKRSTSISDVRSGSDAYRKYSAGTSL